MAMRTITGDYAFSLVSLADSIEDSPKDTARRSDWIDTLRSTCPLHRDATARPFLMRVLESVSNEDPPQRHVDLLRVLSYVVRKGPQ